MNTNKLNFAFWGTPDVASDTLEILKQNGFLPTLIVTSPDAKAGRGMQMQASPVAKFAEMNNILCLKLNTPFDFVTSPYGRGRTGGGIDLFIVVAYGKIIPKNILDIPKFGSINIHYSLLPKYRGASPVESAILNGDTETGVTIQQMEAKMDAGPIIAQERLAIFPDEKSAELRTRLIRSGGELLVKTLSTPSASGTSPYIGGGWVGVKQDESLATFCKKIKKEDGLIDLNSDPVKNYNKFRAYAHWPRTFFFEPARSSGGNGKRIIITDAELKDKKFVIKKILPEGKKEIDYKST